MGTLSSAEKSCVEEFIEYGSDKWGFDTGRALPMTLVFLGERDGCLIGASDSEDMEFLRELFDKYGIPYKEASNDAFFVAKSSSHLSRYDPLGSDRDTGRFLGYPEDAVDFYVNNSDRVSEFHSFIQNESSISEGEWGDKAFLIEYVPCPNEKSVQAALDRQKQYESALRSASVDLSDAHNRNL